jgi:hypothetical protein
MTSLQLHFFWEDCETDFGYRRSVVVPQERTAPNLPDVKRCGIEAGYNNMVQFCSKDLSRYQVVSFALWDFCKEALPRIKNKWVAAEADACNARQREASQRLGIDSASDYVLQGIRREKEPDTRENFYKPPPTVSSLFVGRMKERRDIQEAFFGTAQGSSPPQKRFVVFGIGGSGKTELCRKFADDNKER